MIFLPVVCRNSAHHYAALRCSSPEPLARTIQGRHRVPEPNLVRNPTAAFPGEATGAPRLRTGRLPAAHPTPPPLDPSAPRPPHTVRPVHRATLRSPRSFFRHALHDPGRRSSLRRIASPRAALWQITGSRWISSYVSPRFCVQTFASSRVAGILSDTRVFKFAIGSILLRNALKEC